MTDPFVAEIRINAFNFAPKGWATCDGQLMPISQNTALFSLLGTMYGGDGKSTFGLPDLSDSGAIGVGQNSQSGTEYFQGEQYGSSTVALTQQEMPLHVHTLQASGEPAEQAAPAADRALTRAAPGQPYNPNSTDNLVPLHDQAAAPVGSDRPHNNLPPVVVLNFCVALQGVFPQRP